MDKTDDFKQLFDSKKPHEEQLPPPWNSTLNEFEKIIVLKAIRMDKVLPAI